MAGLQSPGSHRCHGCTLSHLIRLFDCQRSRPGEASRLPWAPAWVEDSGRAVLVNSGRGHRRGSRATVNARDLFFSPIGPNHANQRAWRTSGASDSGPTVTLGSGWDSACEASAACRGVAGSGWSRRPLATATTAVQISGRPALPGPALPGIALPEPFVPEPADARRYRAASARLAPRRVAPVVRTSSIRTTTSHGRGGLRAGRNDPATLASRRLGGIDHCVGRCARRSARSTGQPSSRPIARARTSVWSMPRAIRLRQLIGTGTMTTRRWSSLARSMACASRAARSLPMHRPASRFRWNFRSWITPRSTGSYAPSLTHRVQGSRLVRQAGHPSGPASNGPAGSPQRGHQAVSGSGAHRASSSARGVGGSIRPSQMRSICSIQLLGWGSGRGGGSGEASSLGTRGRGWTGPGGQSRGASCSD